MTQWRDGITGVTNLNYLGGIERLLLRFLIIIMNNQEAWLMNFSENNDVNIKDGVVLIDQVPVGLILPSAIFSDVANEIGIVGRNGVVQNKSKSQEIFYQSMIDAGAICFGTPEEIVKSQLLLKDPVTSRTASYFLACSGSCTKLVDYYKNIRKSKVLIVGCGGIGSLVAINLCGAGINDIHLVDHDKIESTNLNRQFFWTRKDIGRFKCDTLEEVIESRYFGINIKKTLSKITPETLHNFGKDYDAVVVSADEPLGIKKYIRDYFDSLVINTGYIHSDVYYTRLGKLNGDTPTSIWKRNPWFIGPSFGPVNTEIAGVVSSLIIGHICGILAESDHMEEYWNSMSFPRHSGGKVFKNG